MTSRNSLAALLALALFGWGCQRGDDEPQDLRATGDGRRATGSHPARAVPIDEVAQHEPDAPKVTTRVKAQGQLGPGRGTLLIDLRPPADGKLTEGAPLRVSARGRDLSFPQAIRTQLDMDELPVRLPIVVSDGAADPAEVDLTYYWCSHGDSGSCHPVRARLLVELDLSGAGAGGEAHLVHRPDS